MKRRTRIVIELKDGKRFGEKDGKRDWREGGDMRLERRTKYEFGEMDGKRDWRDINKKEETKSFTLSCIYYIFYSDSIVHVFTY